MTRAREVITANTWIFRKEGGHVYHSTTGCNYAQTHLSDLEPVRATTAVLDMIESLFNHASLCITCFGTNGYKPATGTVAEPSRKVTIDTSTSQDDTGSAVTSAPPRKDHHMSRQTLSKTIEPPVTTDGRQASVVAIEQAAANREEWSLDDLAEAVEHKPAPKSALPGWDPVKGTPASVRQRAETSLTRNVAILAAATGSKRADYRWDLQPVPDAEKGKLFSDALVKYAVNRPVVAPIEFAGDDSPVGRVTARCGDPAQFIEASSGFVPWTESMGGEPFWGVRYSVRPWEQRGAGRPAGS